MTKELIAILGLGLTIIAAIFGFGIRQGAMAEQLRTQSVQLELLRSDVKAINQLSIEASILARVRAN